LRLLICGACHNRPVAVAGARVGQHSAVNCVRLLGVCVIVCPSSKCGSPNVADLPHYWQSLPAESPLKGRYAPPPKIEASYWAALAAVAVGIVIVVSGSLLGLLVVAGGVGWGALVHHQLAEAEARLAAWNSSRVCLACTGTF
jgi:hypothetical protein